MQTDRFHDGPLNRPQPSRLWVLGLGCALLVTLAVVTLTWRESLLAAAGRWMNVGERLDHAVDYTFVLGGNPKTRVVMAAALYREGFTRRILLPEVEVPPEAAQGLALPEREVARRILLASAVPPEAIVDVDGEVTSTRDEARALGRFLDQHPEAEVAVVTNDYHTRRARMLFERQVPGHSRRLHFVAAPTRGFGPDNWWKLNNGVNTYVTEFAKLCRDAFR